LGLDDILGGGITPNRMYLVEGTPGTGKTTMSLQYLLEGVNQGERGLYVTLSETEEELRAVAASHGWSLDELTLFELVNEEGLDPDSEQSILHPSEVELGETTRGIMQRVDEVKPSRVVFDSLSEMRLLAQNPLRYRRQVLALKHFFSSRNCTVLMLDDRTSQAGDLQLHSIAHGVVSLEQEPRDFGSERRRLRVVKMRGVKFRGGYHDFTIDTGGISVYPRLVAAEHHNGFESAPLTTGVHELDLMLGGGIVPGTNTLLIGPAGVGKTTTAVACMMAALGRGDRGTYYLFDEGVGTMCARSASLGMDLHAFIESGQAQVRQIDPAELSPGEFASSVRSAVEQNGSKFVVIDSLNAYLQAMPGEHYLILQMHELLTYLNQKGVITFLVLGQHGLLGGVQSDVDLSYLSDSILLFRFFEASGEIRSAMSVMKSRTSAPERTIREFKLGPGGLQLGEPLRDFEGIMSGLPSYRGDVHMLETGGAAGPS
jgi:circadian clock protein KaiC